jgi:hypothetical protein
MKINNKMTETLERQPTNKEKIYWQSPTILVQYIILRRIL